MSNLTQHAKDELKIAGLFEQDSDYNGMIGEAVMELIEVFAKQGHSGHSAPMVVSIFQKLANYQTISSLTGEDSEWNHIERDTYQNNRNSAVFKKGLEGKAYYIDAITWKTQKGHSWMGSADMVSSYQKPGAKPQVIQSRQYIKAFPFTPKKFVIDVIEEEIAKDDWVFHIKNPADMEAVWGVYDEHGC